LELARKVPLDAAGNYRPDERHEPFSSRISDGQNVF
jgi:hypothetical protein